MGLAHTNGQHHQHQLRIAVAPQSTGHHHEISLETPGPGTHERPASPASAANCFWPRNQQVIITRSAWKHLGLAHTNGQQHQHQLRIALAPASPASAANCFWPRSQQVIITRSAWKHLGLAHTNGQHHQHQLRIVITRSAWKHLGLAHTNGQHQLRIALAPQSTGHHNEISRKHLGLAHTNGQHHQHQLRIALAPQSTGHHHEISLETLGPGTHERPASPASAANCFGIIGHHHESDWKHLGLAHTNGQHHQHQLRIAQSTDHHQISELLWPRNQQVIITRSAWKHLGLAHTNDQHHQHQLPIALAPQSTGHHHEISLETLWPRSQQVSTTSISIEECGSGADERPTSRDQSRIAVAPQSTDQHHVH